MASGENLYSGDMFQAMIEKLDQTIASLNDVNTVISQGVENMMIEASDTVQIDVGNEEVYLSSPNGSTPASQILYKAKAYAEGTIKVKWRAKATRNYYSSTVNIIISVTGGGTGQTVSVETLSDFKDYDAEIIVTNGSEITITANAVSVNIAQDEYKGCTGTWEADSLKLCFDMINIVDHRGLIPIAF